MVLWGGLAGVMAVWGVCFRLTFWELSWDVMEPITYFIGSGTGNHTFHLCFRTLACASCLSMARFIVAVNSAWQDTSHQAHVQTATAEYGHMSLATSCGCIACSSVPHAQDAAFPKCMHHACSNWHQFMTEMLMSMQELHSTCTF